MRSVDGSIVPAQNRTDDLARLDLNMLTALRALLQERAVTRAAARLGLGQPAASAALRRLREHFDDPLLVRAAGGYELSPLAAALLGGAEQALAAAESVFLGGAQFQPSATERRFSLMTADATLVHLGERIVPRLTDLPNITVEFMALSDDAMRDPEATLHAVDALVVPRGVLAGYPAADLWTDEYVLATGENSPLRADDLNSEFLSSMAWIISFRGVPAVTASLEAWGVRPCVQFVVPSYAVLPMLLSRSSRHVALIPRRMAARMCAEMAGVRILPWPTQAPPIQLALWWHASRTDDPGHAWFRDLVVAATADMRTEY